MEYKAILDNNVAKPSSSDKREKIKRFQTKNRIRGYRLHPNTKRCGKCKHPKSYITTDGGKNFYCKLSTEAKKRRDVKVPENKKGKTAVLGPKGRWIKSSKDQKRYKLKDKDGKVLEEFNLKDMTRQQRHNLWFEWNYYVDSNGKVIKRQKWKQGKQTERRKSRSGDRRKTRRRGPSISLYKASSDLEKKLKKLNSKNEYRTELNKLLKEKRKQRVANSKINCEIRKWKMGNNPHIIEENRDKLINMTEKACKLSDNYLDLLTDIQVLKNASYDDINKTFVVKKKGGARTRRQRKRRNRTRKRY